MNSNQQPQSNAIRDMILDELRKQLKGLQSKIETDFHSNNISNETTLLLSDPVYNLFGLANREYALTRLFGRVSISIGRRLGELYDKIPRFITQERFGLTKEQVVRKFSNLELDVCIPFEHLSDKDKAHCSKIISKFNTKPHNNYDGIAIEIRYNFNPNDSARIRKDISLAKQVINNNYLPIFLVFSTSSPRDDAIKRLTKAGWIFIIGNKATDFMKETLGTSLDEVLNDPIIQKEIQEKIGSILGLLSKARKDFGNNRDTKKT